MQPIAGLGKRIQELREQRRLSVQELADRADTTYQSIWRIERGEQKDPQRGADAGHRAGLGRGDRLSH